MGSSSFGFPPDCHPSYGASGSCPGGTVSHWTRQPLLVAPTHAGRPAPGRHHDQRSGPRSADQALSEDAATAWPLPSWPERPRRGGVLSKRARGGEQARALRSSWPACQHEYQLSAERRGLRARRSRCL